MFPEPLVTAANTLLDLCRSRGLTLAAAESCTGGLIAGLLTEIAGSSDVVDRGFITYSNQAKHELLGVKKTLIETHGAVSTEVAEAMAEGALRVSKTGLALSVTGIAGPGGATPNKPVGLVFIGIAHIGAATRVERHYFSGTRSDIRLATINAAMTLAIAALST